MMRAQTMWIRIGHLGVMTALVMVMVLSCLAPARADGKFINVSRVGKDPTIRSQSAIIVHRDGVQTLIVGSRIDVEAGALGWILPLPAEPTEIGLATVGMLQTMETLLQPRVLGERDIHHARLIAVPFIWLGVFLTMLVLARQVKNSAGRTSLNVFITLVMLGGGLFILLPSLGKVRGGSVIPGVQVSRHEMLGPYEVAVLSGTSGAAISDWCAANGIALSAEERAVIDDYRAEGWCFLAAMLRAEDDQTMRQPPLRVSFPIDQPVYPMRLTGVTDQPLELDLFTIGGTGMTCHQLDLWWRDHMRIVDEHEFRSWDYSDRTIGHPGIARLLWDGAVVSRLHGRLRPEEMRRDIVLEPGRSTSYRRTIARPADALARAGWWCIIGVSLGVPITLFQLGRSRRRMVIVGTTMAALSLGVPALAGLVMIEVRSIPVNTEHPVVMRMVEHHLQIAVETAERDQRSFQSRADVQRMLADLLKGADDVVQFDRDVPFGIVIESREGFWYATIHDAFAFPTEYRVGRVE